MRDLRHLSSPLFIYIFSSGVRWILGFVRPWRVVVVHIPKTGKRRAHLWGAFGEHFEVCTNVHLKCADPELGHSNSLLPVHTCTTSPSLALLSSQFIFSAYQTFITLDSVSPPPSTCTLSPDLFSLYPSPVFSSVIVESSPEILCFPDVSLCLPVLCVGVKKWLTIYYVTMSKKVY